MYFRGIIFGAAAGDLKGNYFFAGGRSYNRTSRVWDYIDSVWKYRVKTNDWEMLPNLRNATGTQQY